VAGEGALSTLGLPWQLSQVLPKIVGHAHLGGWRGRWLLRRDNTHADNDKKGRDYGSENFHDCLPENSRAHGAPACLANRMLSARWTQVNLCAP
jgi:hypothetical protein